MKYKLKELPVFTCSLPGGAILPSSPRQLRHCVCNLEKSYICMMCNCLSFIKKHIRSTTKFHSCRHEGLLWANPPKQNFKPLLIEITSTTNREFLSKFWMSSRSARKDPYWRFSDDGSAQFNGRQQKS